MTKNELRNKIAKEVTLEDYVIEEVDLGVPIRGGGKVLVALGVTSLFKHMH